MRLICPHCMNGVTVPDDTAGKDASCPSCGKSFPTPSRYAAAVSEAGAAIGSASAPPGLVPPPPAGPTAAASAAPPGLVPPTAPDGSASKPEVPPMAGYAHSCGITISPKAVAWLPAVLLTLLLVLTFFPWVGSYAGDSAVYAQRPWGALFNSAPTRNFKFEESGALPGNWIDKKRSDWRLLLPFFLLLFLAVAFAWVERGLGAYATHALPPLMKVWPWRNSIIAAAAALALFFLVAQLLNGFGMERAIRQQITEQFAERREKATGSPEKLARVEYDEDQAYNAYNVERTTWLYLALVCNALAVGAVMTRVALDKRGNKPPPKILLHY